MPAACRPCCASSTPLLHADALTVNGRTLGENVADAPCYNREVIHTLRQAVQAARPASPCCAATSRPTAR